MEQIRRRFGLVAKLLSTLTALSACKARTASDLQDVSAVNTHYWPEGEYYFRGECAEGQAPSRSCKKNLSSLSKNEIAGVQKRLGQVEKDKKLLKELGLESVVSEADTLQEDYSSKLKLLADLSDPTVSRELVSDKEKDFADRLFKGRASFLDIKSMSVFGESICITTNSDAVLWFSPKGQQWEGAGRSVYAIPQGCLIVEPKEGRNLRSSYVFYNSDPTERPNLPDNILEAFGNFGFLCVTFEDQTNSLRLACDGEAESSSGFVMSDDMRKEKKIIYRFSRTLAQARKSLKVAIGNNRVCWAADESALFCEGRNYMGALGTGDKENRGQRVAVLKDVIDVTAGISHTCALQKGGVLRCWGSNNYGQLGHAYNVIKATDDKAIVMHGVRKVVAKGNNTCAILENKELYCWGQMPTQFVAGQVRPESPKNTTNLKINFIHNNVLDVAVDYDNICALIENKALKCWGKNNSGFLDTNDKNYGDQPGETLDKLPAVFKYEGTPK